MSFDLYLGYEILNQTSPSFEGVQKDNFRNISVMDSKTSKKILLDKSRVSYESRSFKWICFSKAEYKVLQEFILRRKGRLVPFWIPTYTNDLSLTSNIPSNATSFNIQPCLYSDHIFLLKNKKYICFINSLGDIYPRKIETAINNNEYETLSFSVSLGIEINKNRDMVSFLTLARLTDDLTTVNWITRNICECIFNYTELSNEVPE